MTTKTSNCSASIRFASDAHQEQRRVPQTNF